MPTTFPESHVDLITGPYYATFTTLAPNGQPENTVVWCSWDGAKVLVNTVDGSRKAENIKKNPHVALCVVDPKNAFRWVDVRGVVEEIVPDVDYANINAHAKVYANADEYYGSVAPAERKGTERRIVIKIRPNRILAFPNW